MNGKVCCTQELAKIPCLDVQSYLLMRVEQPSLELKTPPGLLEQAHSQWKATCLKVRISQLHSDVSCAVQALGLPITIEQLTDDNLFSIDIAIPGKNSS